jgi:hypothetical protein
MRRKILKTSTVALVGLLALWVVLSPSPVRKSCVNIRLRIQETSKTNQPSLVVIVSNSSQNFLIYHSTIDIACLKNGTWVTNFLSRGGTISMMLRPGESDRPFMIDDAAPIDAGTVAIKAGLDFTCLSWRGRCAWKISSYRFLDPLSSWLFRLDRAKRSRTEWSDVLFLQGADENQTNDSPILDSK